MRHDTWTYHSRASARHSYLTVAVPKVGCTTLKRALHALEGLPPADPWWAVHDAGEQLRLSHYAEPDARRLMTGPEVLRFAFVRNPYDRILSAWKSKVLAPKDARYAPLRARIRAAVGYPPRGDDSPVVAFGDFVRFVATGADDDGHWARQTEVLACDEISYDVVGRFENFAADLRVVLERLGAKPGVVALADEITNPTDHVPLAAAYDSELASIVFDYYRADFDAFGYDRDSWLTPRSAGGLGP